MKICRSVLSTNPISLLLHIAPVGSHYCIILYKYKNFRWILSFAYVTLLFRINTLKSAQTLYYRRNSIVSSGG